MTGTDRERERQLGQVVLALAALVGVLAGLLGIFVTRSEYANLEHRVTRIEDRALTRAPAVTP